MDKNNLKLIPLDSGEIKLYSFDNNTFLHCYSSNNTMNEQVIITEKGNRSIVIENLGFVDSHKELIKYIERSRLNVVGKILAYHMFGGQFLPNTPSYSTPKAIDHAYYGSGAAIIDDFRKSFGDKFDGSISEIDYSFEDAWLSLGGMYFNIVDTPEAFDIELRDINVLYTHFMGHDSHSVVFSQAEIDGLIHRLETYQKRGYDLILSAHHGPETGDDIQIKIDYLKQLKQVTKHAKNASAFMAEMRQAFPDYDDERYLIMTANFLFPNS